MGNQLSHVVDSLHAMPCEQRLEELHRMLRNRAVSRALNYTYRANGPSYVRP